MEILHIHAKAARTVDLSGIKDKLPEKVLLFTTVQYIDQIDEMKSQINAKVIKPKNSHTQMEGQILGCSKLTDEELVDTDAILYVGDGLFHPQATANDKIKVFCYNPKNEVLTELDENFFENTQKKKRLGLNSFYMSENIGVLITTKHGQSRMRFLDKIKETFPKKNFYPIVFDTINFQSLEDFNFLECFINTACPRIGVDDTLPKPCVNVADLEELNLDW